MVNRIVLIGGGFLIMFFMAIVVGQAKACQDASGRLSPAGKIETFISTNFGAGDGLSMSPIANKRSTFCCPGPSHENVAGSAKCCIVPFNVFEEQATVDFGKQLLSVFKQMECDSYFEQVSHTDLQTDTPPMHRVNGWALISYDPTTGKPRAGMSQDGWIISYDSSGTSTKPDVTPPWWALYPCASAGQPSGTDEKVFLEDHVFLVEGNPKPQLPTKCNACHFNSREIEGHTYCKRINRNRTSWKHVTNNSEEERVHVVSWDANNGPPHAVKGGRGPYGEFIFIQAEGNLDVNNCGFFRPTVAEQAEREKQRKVDEARKALDDLKAENNPRAQGCCSPDCGYGLGHGCLCW